MDYCFPIDLSEIPIQSFSSSSSSSSSSLLLESNDYIDTNNQISQLSARGRADMSIINRIISVTLYF